MQIAVLFAALGCFYISVTEAAELTFENGLPPPLELVNHMRLIKYSITVPERKVLLSQRTFGTLLHAATTGTVIFRFLE